MHCISSNSRSLWPSWHQGRITSEGKQHVLTAGLGLKSASAVVMEKCIPEQGCPCSKIWCCRVAHRSWIVVFEKVPLFLFQEDRGSQGILVSESHCGMGWNAKGRVVGQPEARLEQRALAPQRVFYCFLQLIKWDLIPFPKLGPMSIVLLGDCLTASFRPGVLHRIPKTSPSMTVLASRQNP